MDPSFSSENLNGWRKIFHSFKDSTTTPINREFFAYSKDIKKERDFFIETLLRNNSLSKELACNFPSRYTYLYEKIKDIPKINLETCRNLEDFLKNIPGKKISIAMTSEYLNAPSSAFGHIMLVIHQKEEIKLHDKVIHYAAKTSPTDNSLLYSAKGISGGYPGFYIIEPLFQKLYEYSNIEQRYIFHERIKLSDKEVLFLKYHLFELNRAKFNYYFFTKNCAYRVDSLLSIIMNKEPDENILFTLPNDIFKKYASKKGKSNVILPYSSKSNALFSQMNMTEKKQSLSILEGNRKLKETSEKKVKEFTFLYTQYQFKKNKIFNKDYSKTLRAAKSTTSRLSDSVESPKKHQSPSMLSIGINKRKKEKIDTDFTFRPVLNDKYSIQKGSLHESELTILETTLNLKNKLKINELNIFSLKLFAPYSEIFPSLSWQTNLSFKQSVLSDSLINNFNIGIGHTIRMIYYLNYFINIGYEARGLSFTPYIAPQARVFGYLGERIKFGIKATHFILKSNYDTSFELFLNYKLNKNQELLSQVEDSTNKDRKISIKYRLFF